MRFLGRLEMTANFNVYLGCHSDCIGGISFDGIHNICRFLDRFEMIVNLEMTFFVIPTEAEESFR